MPARFDWTGPLFIAFVLLAFTAAARAQTSGIWAAQQRSVLIDQANGSWGDPDQWNLTVEPSDSSGYPDDGGAATFSTIAGSLHQILVDLNVDASIGTLAISNPIFGANLYSAENDTLTLSGPATIIAAPSASPQIVSPTGQTFIGPAILTNLAGSNGLHITDGSGGLSGAAPGVWLGGNNTFTGSITIDGGLLVNQQVSSLDASRYGVSATAAVSDAQLGNVANVLYLDHGATWVVQSNSATPPAFSSQRNIVLNPGGGGLRVSNVPMSLLGQVSGSGSFQITGAATFLNANPYTGNTQLIGDADVVLASNGTLDGSFANTPYIDNQSTLILDNTTRFASRLPSTGTMTMLGAQLALLGNGSTVGTQNFGTISLNGGLNTFTFGSTAGGITTLNLTGLNRQNGAVAFFRGENLGAATTSLTSRLTVGASSALTSQLVGGGGAAGSTDISILPWAFGDASSASATGIGNTASLVTYDPSTGIRPLDLSSEYATSVAAAASNSNVRYTTSDSAVPSKTINALVLDSTSGGGPIALSGGTIAVTSGEILSTASGNSLANAVSFGSRQGVLINTAGFTLSGAISGTGGLVHSGGGSLLLSGPNTYLGTTTLGAGFVTIRSDVADDGATAGPFGLSTNAIVLSGGTDTPGGAGQFSEPVLRTDAGRTVTFARPLSVIGQSVDPLDACIQTDSASAFNFTGTISIAGRGGPSVNNDKLGILGGNVTFSGPITGGGVLRTYNANSVPVVLTLPNANTYTGGTELDVAGATQNPSDPDLPTTVYFGNDSAFGTGQIYVAGAATLSATSAGARTIANPLNLVGTLSLSGWPTTFTGTVDAATVNTLAVYSTTTFAGDLTGGGLIKQGTGTLILSHADNTLIGNITVGSEATPSSPSVAGGVVRVAAPGALGSGASASVLADGGAIELSNPGSLTQDFFILGNGAGFTGALRSISGDNSIDNLNLIGNGTAGVTSGNASATVGVDAGTLTVRGTLNDETGYLSGSQYIPSTATLIKVGAGTLVMSRVSDLATNANGMVTPYPLAALNITTGTVTIAQTATANAATSTSVVKRLTIDTGVGAALDLGNNSLVIDYTGSSSPIGSVGSGSLSHTYAAGSIQQYLQASFNSNSNSFTGPGIRSSATVSTTPLTAIGAVDNAALAAVQGSGFTTFGGVAVPSTSVLVGYTYFGDANLDGVVNGADFQLLELGYLGILSPSWMSGDFNYDGKVDGVDFQLAELGLLFQGAPLTLTGVTPGIDGPVASVPEPCNYLSLALLLLWGILLPGRRIAVRQ